MKEQNLDIKRCILKNNLRFWQVAYKLNMNDGNFSRLLRKELTTDKKNEIYKVIDELKEEK